MKRVHLVISGYVQGVFFRASAQGAARSLKLTGFVRNLPDGSVEAVAEGEEPMLNRFLEWCRKGPPGARVANVSVTWEDAQKDFKGFNIR